MRLAYADPPYPDRGRAVRHYGDHPDYAGDVDHGELAARLAGFDGWVLHTSSTALAAVLAVCPPAVRVAAWVKPFASFKPGVQVAYAWEPVLFVPARKHGRERPTVRDWIAEPITLQRGLAGAKPDAVCRWAFELIGADPDDELWDLYPGTGAVTDAWHAWRAAPSLLTPTPADAEPLWDGD